MKLRQLMEGQRQQVEGLSKRGPVALYMPTTMEQIRSIWGNYEASRQPLPVTMSLQYAVQYSNLVIKFFGLGKDLDAEALGLRATQQAAQEYPESYNPAVSKELMSGNYVYYSGGLQPERADAFYVVRNGKPEQLDVSQFMDYMLKYRNAEARRRSRQVDVEVEPQAA